MKKIRLDNSNASELTPIRALSQASNEKSRYAGDGAMDSEEKNGKSAAIRVRTGVRAGHGSIIS